MTRPLQNRVADPELETAIFVSPGAGAVNSQQFRAKLKNSLITVENTVCRKYVECKKK
jgi:hypothetical protein